MTKKYRFDLVLFSNFLTNEEQVTSLEGELQGAIRYLRNRGLAVVVGAQRTSDKYRKVYRAVDRVIRAGNYSNWRFRASCTKAILLPHAPFSYDDRFGERVKSLIRLLLERAEEMGCAAQIPSSVVNKLRETISPEYRRTIQWETRVYLKHSRLRNFKRRR
jgi:hypothetical protein